MGNGRRVGAIAVAALLIGGAAACGGDDDNGDDAALEEVGDDSSSDETTEASSDGSVTTVDVGDIPFLSDDCETVVEAMVAFGAVFAGTAEGSDLGDLADSLEDVAGDAPEEIRDDLNTVIQAYRDFVDAAGDLDFTDPRVFADPDFAAAAAVFDDPEYVDASNAVTAYLDENCSGPTG